MKEKKSCIHSKKKLIFFFPFIFLFLTPVSLSLYINIDLAAAFSVSGVAQDSISNALTSLEDQVANVVLPVKESTDKSKKDAKEGNVIVYFLSLSTCCISICS